MAFFSGLSSGDAGLVLPLTAEMGPSEDTMAVESLLTSMYDSWLSSFSK